MRQIRIGEMSGGKTRRLEWVEYLAEGWFFCKAFSDIHQLVWEKFICNVLCSAPATVLNAILESCSKILSSRSRTWMYDGSIWIGCAKGSIFERRY